jgi:tetratricopeptide (TPR) repeat protein
MEILQKGIRNVTERKAALHIALAENTERARDLPGARRVYEDAMAAKILGEEAWLGIARTYLAARPPDRARAMEYAIKATAAKNASAVDAYALAGQIALSDDDLAKAEEYLLQGYKLAPNSIELASQLSTLYERLKAEAARNADSAKVIDYLTRSINVAPTLAKLYDRGREYFDLYKGPNERIKAYHLASNDYMAARAIARREDGVLAQFPWLMPNLIEALIFEGRFAEAKQYSEELFEALGSDAAVRPSTDAREIRIIGAFLNAAAEMLANGSAEKEVYLLENAKLGKDPKSLSPWSFAEMRIYLDEDYGPANKTVAPPEAQARIAIVKQWIDGLDSSR